MNRKVFCSTLAITLAATLLGQPALTAPEEHSDVVVYGGTSGGVTAAVQAARMGKKVVLIEPGHDNLMSSISIIALAVLHQPAFVLVSSLQLR